MEDIVKDDLGNNVGGLAVISFIPIEDVANVADVIDGVVEHAPILHADKIWFEIEASLGSKGFKEVPVETAQGSCFDVEVTGWVPKDRPEVMAIIEEMDDREFLVKFGDNNGLLHLGGRKEYDANEGDRYGLRAKITRGIGADWASGNGAGVVFYGRLPKRTPFLLDVE